MVRLVVPRTRNACARQTKVQLPGSTR